MIEKIKKIIKSHTQIGKNFGKYLFIGIVWTVLNIFLMWLVIDILKVPTLLGATLIISVLFVGKFYVYIFIGLLHNKFIKYASTVIGFSLSNIMLMWLFVDIFHITAVVSSSIIVGGLFILRFITFGKAGLIKKM